MTQKDIGCIALEVIGGECSGCRSCQEVQPIEKYTLSKQLTKGPQGIATKMGISCDAPGEDCYSDDYTPSTYRKMFRITSDGKFRVTSNGVARGVNMTI